ncbi:hypothetical protein AGMMS49942_16980 [Spirochaetia bacterium]|nr:hypothetical protein AGMMS49942_16980 [Spirochaetia bacterium]
MTNKYNYQKAYYEKHPEALAKKRLLQSKEYRELRAERIKLYGGKCEVCGTEDNLCLAHPQHPENVEGYKNKIADENKEFLLCSSHHKTIDNRVRALLKKRPDLKPIEEAIFLEILEAIQKDFSIERRLGTSFFVDL